MSTGGSFAGASVTELRAMIANTSPETLDTVAARWEAVDIALQQAQEDLLHHARAATTHWSGAAADAFTARAEQLHSSLGSGAAYASHASSGVSFAADSLRVARLAMPPEPVSLEGEVTVEEARTAGTAASELLEQQRRQAVAVMERLEEKYAEAARMFGTPASLDQSHDLGAFREKVGHSTPELQTGLAAAHGPRPLEPAGSAPSNAQSPSLKLENTFRIGAQRTNAIAGPTNAISSSSSTNGMAGASQLNHFAEITTNQNLESTPREPFALIGAGTSSYEDLHAGNSPEIGMNAMPSPNWTPMTTSSTRLRRTELSTRDQHGITGASKHTSASFSNQETTRVPEVVGGTSVEAPPKVTQGEAERADSDPPYRNDSNEISGWASPQSTRGRGKSRGKRPTYLMEDEQHWLPEQQVNPPVIT